MVVKLSSPVVAASHDARRLKVWAVVLVALTTAFFIGAVVLGEIGLPPLTLWSTVSLGVVATPLVVAFHLSWVAWRREHKVADLIPGGVALLVLLAMLGTAFGSGYVWVFTAYVVGLGGVLWLGRTALHHARSRPHARPAATGGPEAPPRMYFLPHSRVGLWALALLLLAGLYPLYWNLLMDTIPDVGVAVVAAVLVLTPLVLARVAIFRRNDRSVLLIALAAAILLMVLFGVMFAIALLLQAVWG